MKFQNQFTTSGSDYTYVTHGILKCELTNGVVPISSASLSGPKFVEGSGDSLFALTSELKLF